FEFGPGGAPTDGKQVGAAGDQDDQDQNEDRYQHDRPILTANRSGPRCLAELDVGVVLLALTHVGDLNGVTGAPGRNLRLKVDHARHPVTVDGDHEVTGVETGLGGRGSVLDVDEEGSGTITGAVTPTDPEEPAFGGFPGDYAISDHLRDVYGHRETDSDVAAGTGLA